MKPLLLIAQIGDAQLGGAERQFLMLADGLVKRGITPHLATVGALSERLITFAHQRNIPLFSLGKKGKFDLRPGLRLLRYLKQNHIDLLQGWMPTANAIAGFAAWQTHTPLVMGIRTSMTSRPGLGWRFYLAASRFFANRTKATLVCNSEEGMTSHAAVGFDRAQMTLIPNGFAPPDRSCFAPPFSGPTIKIGTVTRIDPIKNIESSLEAFALIADCYPQGELHLYGSGDKEYCESLKRLAESLGIAQSVVWHGSTDKIWDAYAELDIYLSSSHGEGMSNSLLEAMAAGRVVVTTDGGNSQWLVISEEGNRGYISPTPQPADLAATLRMVLENRSDSLACASRGSELMRYQFDPALMVENYLNLYLQITKTETPHDFATEPKEE